MPAIRPVHYQRLIRVFEKDGFRFDRQEGDRQLALAGYGTRAGRWVAASRKGCGASFGAMGAAGRPINNRPQVAKLPHYRIVAARESTCRVLRLFL
jgi:hypothetical protein